MIVQNKFILFTLNGDPELLSENQYIDLFKKIISEYNQNQTTVTGRIIQCDKNKMIYLEGHFSDIDMIFLRIIRNKNFRNLKVIVEGNQSENIFDNFIIVNQIDNQEDLELLAKINNHIPNLDVSKIFTSKRSNIVLEYIKSFYKNKQLNYKIFWTETFSSDEPYLFRNSE